MDSLYHITLFIHSWNRWLVLVSGISVIFFAVSGISGHKSYKILTAKT